MAFPFSKKSTPSEPKTSLVLKDEAKEVKNDKTSESVVRHSSRTYPVADHRILKKPITTEKTFRLANQASSYVFEVERRANKLEIKKAFFNVYGIHPTGVNVLHGGGERTRRGKVVGTKQLWKRAVITIPRGEKLEHF